MKKIFQIRLKFDELITQFDDGSFALAMDYFDYDWSSHMFSDNLQRLLGRASRALGNKLWWMALPQRAPSLPSSTSSFK